MSARKGVVTSPRARRPDPSVPPRFNLPKDESSRPPKRRLSSPEPPRKQPFRMDAKDVVLRAVEEATMMGIEATPSDSRMVEVLLSFRTQAAALGALGIFDKPDTVIGKMLNDRTGGYEQLLAYIDAHIATERAKEPVVDMDAYMKRKSLPKPLPYVLFDDAKLRLLEVNRIQAELDVADALERVIDAAWDAEDADLRIRNEMEAQAEKLIVADVAVMQDAVRVTNNRMTIDALTSGNMGSWSPKVADPEFKRLRELHELDLKARRAATDAYDTPSHTTPSEASGADGDLLPPLENVTDGFFDWLLGRNDAPAPPPADPYTQRREALERLRRGFPEEQYRLLESEEFVDNAGGVCDWVCGFAKYADMWRRDNPGQAAWTALPAGLYGIAAAAAAAEGAGLIAAGGAVATALGGLAGVPVIAGSIVVAHTARGILKRRKRNQGLTPPALQSLLDALKKMQPGNFQNATVGDILPWVWRGGLSGLALDVALEAYHHHNLLGFLGAGPRFGRAGAVAAAAKAREYIHTLAAGPEADMIERSKAIGFFRHVDRRAQAEATTRTTSALNQVPSLAERVRNTVDWVYSNVESGAITRYASPLLLIGDACHGAWKFNSDNIRPDRARIYLYLNDAEKASNKQMIERTELAMAVLPILYANARGAKTATWDQQIPKRSIEKWITDQKPEEMLADAAAWKNWYVDEIEWYGKTNVEIIDFAKRLAKMRGPIRAMDEILQSRFKLSPAMLPPMGVLKDSWTSKWLPTWSTMHAYAQEDNGTGVRDVHWLAENKDEMKGTYAGSLSRRWFKLYKVLEYQHAYIIGGINPSITEAAEDKFFGARATERNRPSFVTMIEEMNELGDSALNQADTKVYKLAGRSSITLAAFDRVHTAKVEELFDKYYVGWSAAAEREANARRGAAVEAAARREEREEERRRAAEAGRPLYQLPQLPQGPGEVLDQNDLQGLFNNLPGAAPNPAPQPDDADDFPAGPLQPVPQGGAGVQASVVDEVYARVSALRL